ncbi:FkbM family methyltransferase [Candidatus Woesearchaeota archaeon]|jgi:FkbM family methyltransferase|nr:FkbM family methyltransferase [Candidatus Woesearchaeota archaeon]
MNTSKILKIIKIIIKYILFTPMAIFHKLTGVNDSYNDLISFSRYFPFGRLFKNSSGSFKYKNKTVLFSYKGNRPLDFGVFANNEYKHLTSVIDGAVVIDIGAATADTAILFYLNGAKKVLGYELNKRQYELAQHNVSINNLEEYINIQYCGVSATPINRNDEILGAIMKDGDRDAISEADFITLDQISSQLPDGKCALKVDVDGYEYDIFDSVSIESLRKYETIFLEYHFGVKGLVKKLTKAGFLIETNENPPVFIDRHPDKYKKMTVGYILAKRVSL